MRLGEKIKKLRSDHGDSQADLAMKLSVSRQSISKWENESSTPSIYVIQDICTIYGSNVSDFLDSKQSDIGVLSVDHGSDLDGFKKNVIYYSRTKWAKYIVITTLLITTLSTAQVAIIFNLPILVFYYKKPRSYVICLIALISILISFSLLFEIYWPNAAPHRNSHRLVS